MITSFDGEGLGPLSPFDVSLFENVTHIIFIEVMSFNWNGLFRFWIEI